MYTVQYNLLERDPTTLPWQNSISIKQRTLSLFTYANNNNKNPLIPSITFLSQYHLESAVGSPRPWFKLEESVIGTQECGSSQISQVHLSTCLGTVVLLSIYLSVFLLKHNINTNLPL